MSIQLETQIYKLIMQTPVGRNMADEILSLKTMHSDGQDFKIIVDSGTEFSTLDVYIKMIGKTVTIRVNRLSKEMEFRINRNYCEIKRGDHISRHLFSTITKYY